MNVPLEHANALAGWYGRERCPGSPESLLRIQRLARRIWVRDFPKVIEEGELVTYVFTVLTYCFGHFQRSMGNPDVSIEDRFVAFFRYCFRRKLQDMAWDRRRSDRRRATVHYLERKAAQEPSSRNQHAFMEWAWFVYRQTLRRLSRDAQRYIQLHLVQRKTVEAIVPIMGLSKSTLCRKFGSARLVELFRSQVNAMTTSIPPDHLEQFVCTLHEEDQLDEDEIARLLCVPESHVVEILLNATGKVVNRLDETAVRRLFEG
jgi:AraC-like DNA-binding protein